MISAFIEGIGLCGPGLDGWAQSAGVLNGSAPYLAAPASPAASTLLPAAERRRAPHTVKLALAVGVEAFAACGRDATTTPTIFASSGGDGETIHEILNTLSSAVRELSPTRFHNSVHNAAAGYWSIATAATAASTSLCAHDDSFAAGLLETLAQTGASGRAAALIAYDVPYPEPLFAVRPVGAVFGVALVLTPAATPAAFARLELSLLPGARPCTPAAPALEGLRRSTPIARCLPLLTACAGSAPAEVMLNYLNDMTLRLTITPIARPAS